MINLFDYIYYRMYKFCVRQKDNVPETTALVLLSLMQFLTLGSILFLINLLVKFQIPSKWSFVLVMLLIGIYNWYRYGHNFDINKYANHWENEKPSEKKKKGWLIIAWFAIVVLIPVSIGVLRHNLGLIQ